MARFFQVNARMFLVSEMEKREKYGLEKGELTIMFNPMVMDLERVVTYCHEYNDDGEVIPGRTEVTLSHGGYLVIEMAFEDFDKTIKDAG